MFVEDFENTGQTPVLLENYVGAPPLNETYTADPPWLDPAQCNGIILNPTSPDQPDCPNALLRSMASALGEVGGTNPPTNNVVTAYTNWVNPGADLVEFRTEQPIPIATPNRYISFAVDAAVVNCEQAQPLLKFYLTGGGPDIPTFTTPINPCTDPNSKPYPGGNGIMAGSFAGNSAVLFTGTELGIKMVNGQGQWFGNDHAFDNIRILDATPQLDNAFSPATIDEGGISTLTMTVTNTSELAAKNNFTFTDRLPAGVSVASTPNATTTCGDGTVSAVAGGSSVTLGGGDLAADEVSCTVTVNVTADATGAYVSGPDRITAVGLNSPNSATLTVVTPPVVLEHPSDQVVSAGEDATFTADASGDPAPTVQWQRQAAAGGPWTDIPGATSTTYTLTDATLADSGSRFRAVFTNAAGTTVTTNPATLTVVRAPTTPPATTPPATTSPGGPSGTLPPTGASVTGLLAFVVALLIAGSLAIFGIRIRRTR
ncbi:immunoglobulin domain-containing protein [Streptomyces sp. NPDC002896]|uniref:DUF7933 domain-containing protein n=1 Tax=Streptomyces sp. NPDC002896 TaxID=3154438 RepID=UPI0033306200